MPVKIAWTLSNTNSWPEPLAKPPLHPAIYTAPRKLSAPPVPLGNFSPNSHGPQTNPLETLRNAQKNSTDFPSQQEPQTAPPATANLMQLFYAYFHSAHPFCLPPAYLIKTSAHQLTALLPVMRYIASFFARTAPTETFAREAENALFGTAHPPPQDAFTVQALLLFAIGLHSDNDQERAAQVKDIAADLALELGMNLKEFSTGSASGRAEDVVLEESWRRTWWELYFLDGMMAGIHQRDGFRLWSVECTVPLPCEESQYMLGRIPEPHSLQEFDDRYFAAENTVFSSFAYRVEAVRILGQVLAVSSATAPQLPHQQGQQEPVEDPRSDAADASLVNWGLHLPDKKKELVNKERRVDEMLFQAHMVINAWVSFASIQRLVLTCTEQQSISTAPSRTSPFPFFLKKRRAPRRPHFTRQPNPWHCTRLRLYQRQTPSRNLSRCPRHSLNTHHSLHASSPWRQSCICRRARGFCRGMRVSWPKSAFGSAWARSRHSKRCGMWRRSFCNRSNTSHARCSDYHRPKASTWPAAASAKTR